MGSGDFGQFLLRKNLRSNGEILEFRPKPTVLGEAGCFAASWLNSGRFFDRGLRRFWLASLADCETFSARALADSHKMFLRGWNLLRAPGGSGAEPFGLSGRSRLWSSGGLLISSGPGEKCSSLGDIWILGTNVTPVGGSAGWGPSQGSFFSSLFKDENSGQKSFGFWPALAYGLRFQLNR